jgi:hypothetical protein
VDGVKTVDIENRKLSVTRTDIGDVIVWVSDDVGVVAELAFGSAEAETLGKTILAAARGEEPFS